MIRECLRPASGSLPPSTWIRWLQVSACVLVLGLGARGAEHVPLGAGSFLRGLPEGTKGPPRQFFATEELANRPMPSNDWWSSLAWEAFSDVLHAHPLALKAEPAGLRIWYPGSNLSANREGIFGTMAGGGDDLVIAHSAIPRFSEARVAGWSDWFVTARMGTAARGMRLTFGHGSPFVFVEYADGEPTIRFSNPPKIYSGGEGSATLAVKVGSRCYGLFAPSGSRWSGLGTAQLSANTGGRSYFSVAILPDDSRATLDYFARRAHVHVSDSTVSWDYEEAKGQVRTTFRLATRNWEGADASPLMALYPHQWRASGITGFGSSYDSVRGPMKVFEGREFRTEHPLPPVLPFMPLVPSIDPEAVRTAISQDLAPPTNLTGDTYWVGKSLGKWATILPLAEQSGDTNAVAECERRLRRVLEGFLTAGAAGAGANGDPDGLFAYDPVWGTLIGLPASYGSDDSLNDHHFHYGYFLKAAAELGRRDEAWLKRWAPMLRLLIRDVATPDRNDGMFPFLRCFDPYAGHSWASGHAKFPDGNNNESSSEAVNAWVGVLMLGELLEDRTLRDLGAWLAAMEVSAIEDYWFDVRDELHPPGYTPSVVTMVWGGKGANATWFSANPEAVHGINFLPVTAGSLYLGRWPEYVRRNHQALIRENLEFDRAKAGKSSNATAALGTPEFDQWADLMWMYLALVEPEEAWRQWQSRSAQLEPEFGNSRAQTLAWIGALREFGAVDRSISADSAFAATFRRAGLRTHVAWNPGRGPRIVAFTDGTSVACETRSLRWSVGAGGPR